MSLWKFNDFEQELDFTDLDFLERIEYAQECLPEDLKKVPTEGKASVIVRAQIRCYDNFIDRIFEEGASKRIFKTNALSERIDAVVSLKACEDKQTESYNQQSSRYQVNKGNRAQRRADSRKKNRYYS